MSNISNKQVSLSKIIKILEKELPSLRNKYHIEYFGIFGSFTREEQNETSDLDILVRFNVTPSLFQFIQLEQYLTLLLNIKVDLVMEDTLKPAIGKHILSEVMEL